jgi:hypothetical protein
VAEKVRTVLTQQRQLLSLKSSSFRDAYARMNEQVAQAFRDGLKITVLAKATELSRTDVRRIAWSFEDLDPTGTSEKEHLTRIACLRAELAAIGTAKEEIEEKRLRTIAQARRNGIMDDYELASLSGLNPAYIGKMTWGVLAQTAPESDQ